MDIDDCNYKLFSKSDLSSSLFDAINPGGLLKTQTEDLHQKSDALISSILWQSEKNTAIQLEVNFRPVEEQVTANIRAIKANSLPFKNENSPQQS